MEKLRLKEGKGLASGQQVAWEVGFEPVSFCPSKTAGCQVGVRLSTKMGDLKTDARQGEKKGGLLPKIGEGKVQVGDSG